MRYLLWASQSTRWFKYTICTLSNNPPRYILSSILYFFKYKFIYFNWSLITLQYCSGFAIHWHESATCVPVKLTSTWIPRRHLKLGLKRMIGHTCSSQIFCISGGNISSIQIISTHCFVIPHLIHEHVQLTLSWSIWFSSFPLPHPSLGHHHLIQTSTSTS